MAAIFLLAAAGCDLSAGVPLSTPPPQPTAATALPPQTPSPPAPTSTLTGSDLLPSTRVPTTPNPASQTACAALEKSSSRDSIGDPLFPGMGNGGYDVLNYDLDLAVDVPSNVITSSATISARATTPLDAFNLDFAGLTVRSASVDGAPARFERNDRELTLTPSSSIATGQEFTATINYGGTPITTTSGTSLGWIKTNGGTYVAGEPGGAETWYPVNNHPCDKATYKFRVTVLKPYVVAANGLLLSAVDNGASRTYTFATSHPAAGYLVTVNIARFDVKEETGPGGLPMRFYFPQDLDAVTRGNFDATGQMIEFYSSIFGPYPFESYGSVVADADFGFALETQTLSLFGRRVAGRRAGAEEVISHELAHQWFGDSVSLAQWKDIWLNEGFATYAQWLWLEHTQGQSAFEARIQDMHRMLVEQRAAPPGSPGTSTLFDMGVYIRGAMTLHALRLEIGDEAFFKTLREYAARFRDGNASTQDFISVAEKTAGRDLKSLFDSWLYATATPPLPAR